MPGDRIHDVDDDDDDNDDDNGDNDDNDDYDNDIIICLIIDVNQCEGVAEL